MQVGDLEVEIVAAKDLQSISSGTAVYATLSLFEDATTDESYRAKANHEFEIMCFKAGAGGTIGVSFGSKDSRCLIDEIKTGSPAEYAHCALMTQLMWCSGTALRTGDLITHINDVPVMKTNQALKLIREAKFEVKLRVTREGEAEAPAPSGKCLLDDGISLMTVV